MASLDPLDLLRQYTTQKKPVELLDKDGNLTTDLLTATTVRFGEDASFARDTPTSYLRSNSDSDQYTLSALMHFLDNRDQSFYDYMKTASTMGLQAVSFGDRGALVDYLTGKTPVAPSSAHAGEKRAGEDGGIGGSGSNEAGRRTRARTQAPDDAVLASDPARDIMRRERSLRKSFARVPDLIKELNPSKHAKPVTDAAKPPGAVRRQSQRKRANPIIVVPAATTAMINMYNVQALLGEHKFVDSRVVMEQGGAKPREILIDHVLTRSSTEQTLKFRVVDSTQDFTDAIGTAWCGAAWQFKNWIWKTPEDVFNNAMGLYPKFNDEKPKDSIKTWGISLLNIERSKRHMDRATIVGLWNNIEQYLARQKPDFLV
ncbi:RNA pol II accessory factor, Cdc73 family-domain-containing protein [Kickxella alabastrina]|uniref:RNA pol II accessory factor, Cdc73 family-domain-containing protein n=1 Tax=Kickxella alabastrina TaxID=61397 RepID=UPI00221E51DA|nr:RNA pol II accessory factor, Cdc73 family-domain-containing protein [Kickxella alabastrina]KAI7820903.1 RNA pol II accessory factor, Cdc73 family-domain-containing protein [Kickxella alabastrina]